jgi:hypothetical protein
MIVPLRLWEKGPTKAVRIVDFEGLSAHIQSEFDVDISINRLYFYTDDHNLATMDRVDDQASFSQYLKNFPRPILRIYSNNSTPSHSPQPSKEDLSDGAGSFNSRAPSVPILM